MANLSQELWDQVADEIVKAVEQYGKTPGNRSVATSSTEWSIAIDFPGSSDKLTAYVNWHANPSFYRPIILLSETDLFRQIAQIYDQDPDKPQLLRPNDQPIAPREVADAVLGHKFFQPDRHSQA